MTLAPKHQAFVREYLIDHNATQAALRAGYSNVRAKQQGSWLLARDDVQAAIAAATLETAKAAEVTIAETVDTLAAVLRANMLDYMTIGEDGQPHFDFSKLTREQAAVISEVIVETTPGTEDEDGSPVRPEVRKVRFKLHDKLAAADKLLRHLGGYVDRKVVDHRHELVMLTDGELQQRIQEKGRLLGLGDLKPLLLTGPKT